jgi:hypothetical protein
MRFIPNYDPEVEMFTLHDTEEQCFVIVSKEQLEELMELYHRCFPNRRI